MKKTLAIILSLATLTLTANLFPLTASAVELNSDYSSSEQKSEPITIIDSGVCGENVTWTLDSNYCLTISGTGKMGGWTDSISMPWYKYQHEIKTAKITPGVTSIHFATFIDCARLESVEIPDTILEIGWCAFNRCSSLKSLEIPKSVIDIANDSLSMCTRLEKIKVDPNNPFYCDVNGVLYNKDKTTLILFPPKINTTSFVVPDSVQIIDMYAFGGCTGLTSITIPDGVTKIRNEAFYKCRALTSIVIPNSVETLGIYAFEYCTSLTSVKLSKNLETVEPSIFSNCPSLEDVFIYNKDCVVTDAERTIPGGAIIRGYSGSTAEEYAIKYEREFVDFSFGDVNRDGLINAVDASLVISAYAMIAVGKDSDFDKKQMISADVNDNENIDAIDASVILGYYAYTATGGENDFETFLSK